VRGLATIGGNLGRASPASDLAPPLIVLGASAEITGPGGVRTEPVESLFTGPGTTTLVPGDLITAIVIPAAPPDSGSAYLKIGSRGSGTDIAIVGAAAFLHLDEAGQNADARLALASVAPTPLLAANAGRSLAGAMPGEEAFAAAAAEAAVAESHPISDVRGSAAYRLALVRVLTVRALRAAMCRAAGEGGA
jgi:carbon-monoxide dehydrogenase medium subunit